MTERRRPPRRGRTTRPKTDPVAENGGEDNPYRESPTVVESSAEPPVRVEIEAEAPPERASREPDGPPPASASAGTSESNGVPVVSPAPTPERTRPDGSFGGHPHPR